MSKETETQEKSLSYVVVVQASPELGKGAQRALSFCQALCASPHQLSMVFFYGNGARNADTLYGAEQNPSWSTRWANLTADGASTELLVCIGSATRRGIVDRSEQRRLGLPSANLAEGFVLGSLGDLASRMGNADRLLTFLD